MLRLWLALLLVGMGHAQRAETYRRMLDGSAPPPPYRVHSASLDDLIGTTTGTDIMHRPPLPPAMTGPFPPGSMDSIKPGHMPPVTETVADLEEELRVSTKHKKSNNGVAIGSVFLCLCALALAATLVVRRLHRNHSEDIVQALANERSATGATPAAATGSSSSSSSAAAAAAAAAPLMGKTAASSSAAAPAYGALPPTTMLKPWGYSKLDP